MKDPRNSIIFALVIGIVVLTVLFVKHKAPAVDTTLPKIIKMLQDSLAHQNAANTRLIDFERSKAVNYKRQSDSLLALPPKFKKDYTNAEKYIDKATAGQLIYGFDSIFAANNIR